MLEVLGRRKTLELILFMCDFSPQKKSIEGQFGLK